MAQNNQAFYELYRRSSIGMALTDTLDDLISDRRIEPQLAMKILANFDRSITEALAEKVKARLSFKGHLDTYRFCDEVWTFLIKDVTFKMDNQAQPVIAEKIRIFMEMVTKDMELIFKSTAHLPNHVVVISSVRNANTGPTAARFQKQVASPAAAIQRSATSTDGPPLPLFAMQPLAAKNSSLDQGSSTAMENPANEFTPLLGSKTAASHSLSQRHGGAETTPQRPHLEASPDLEVKDAMEFKDLSRKSQWIALAVMSGACAAFNGVFAKLTTTELTTTFATWIASLFGLGKGEKVVEYIVRAIFFSLNLIFNGIMWTLFTKALARGTSTTQVSILNTSSNFMITAILGFLIFSESLPPLWFLGAALLVAGNVIIGRREEKDTLKRDADEESGHGEDEGLLVEGEEVEYELEDESEALERKRKEREEEDVLQVDLRGDVAGDLVDVRHR
ncbi:hypothetical protein HYALB_00002323 [Hymenoscyphus albidus]|uniref:Transcription initiation factor IIA subunit 2 n=1 Tax=Hymenoscyphus albidus TaxID=595503 RepID=A0A9N9M1L6_9HELO|nr:hypothetical protein HYALB_00002323 [Hymenoscyphus albidus]